MRLAICFFVLFLSFTRPAWSFFEYQVSVKHTTTDFFIHRENHSINDQETLESSFEFVYDNEKNLKLLIKPWLKVDFLDASRNRYIPNETYFLYHHSHFEFSAGLQRVALGVSEVFSPTDVLNRYDLEDHFYSPSPLGELMVGAKYMVDQMGFLTDTTFQFVALPWFQETPLPENDTRFALAGTQSGISYSLIEPQEDPDFIKGFGVAFIFSTTINNFDLQLVYYHGPDRSPGYYLRVDDRGALRLGVFYYTIDMFGTNVEASVGDVIFHAETAYRLTTNNAFKAHDISPVRDNAIPNSYLQFVTGVEYTFVELFGPAHLRLMMEYTGEIADSSSYQSFRPFDHDIILGMQILFNNRLDSSLEWGVFKDLTQSEAVFYSEFSSKIYREIRCGVKGFFVNRASANQPFSMFDNNSYVTAFVLYDFGKRFRP